MNQPKRQPPATTRKGTAIMASITERLSRDEWNPQPGDIVVGVITEIRARSIITKADSKELWFPVVALDTDDGQGVIVDCGRGGLAGPVIEARPKVGQRIGFRFIGPVDGRDGKSYDKFVVEFENETPSEPDWDKMAASRGISPREPMPDEPRPPDEPAPDEWAF